MKAAEHSAACMLTSTPFFSRRINQLPSDPSRGVGSLRRRTPREVVAHAIDYADWVEELKPEDFAAVYARFAPELSLADNFKDRFGSPGRLSPRYNRRRRELRILCAGEVDRHRVAERLKQEFPKAVT